MIINSDVRYHSISLSWTIVSSGSTIVLVGSTTVPGRLSHSPGRLSHSPGRLSHRSLLRRRCIAAASSLRRRRVAVCRESVLTWRLPFYDERPREVPDDGGVVILVGIWRRAAGGVGVAPEVEKRDEWASPSHRKRKDEKP